MSLIESRLKEYNFSPSLNMDSKLTNGIIYLKDDDHRKAVIVPGEMINTLLLYKYTMIKILRV